MKFDMEYSSISECKGLTLRQGDRNDECSVASILKGSHELPDRRLHRVKIFIVEKCRDCARPAREQVYS